MELRTNTRADQARPARRTTAAPLTVLNFFPAKFSAPSVEVGVGLWVDREHASALRDAHQGLRTWRDRGDGSRLYAWFRDGRAVALPGFRQVAVRADEAPMLLKRMLNDAVEQRFIDLGFTQKGNAFVNYSKGSLLAQVPALAATAKEAIGVYAKIIPRVHYTWTANRELIIGVVADVLYTTRLDVPTSEWVAAGLGDQIRGCYVVLLPETPEAKKFPELVGRSVGRIDSIGQSSVTLADRRHPEVAQVALTSCAPEPTRVNLGLYLAARHAAGWKAGEGQLREKVNQLVRPRRRHELAEAAVGRLTSGLIDGLPVYGALRATLSPMVRVGDSAFPTTKLKDAVFSFDPSSDRRVSRRVDSGLRDNGPYDRAQGRGRALRILVVALEENRREVESGIKKLANGVATTENVFGGLKSMYRLGALEVVYAFAPASSANVMTRYADAAREAIGAASPRAAGQSKFDLLIAVTAERFRTLRDSENPYFQTKALALVLDGVPTQAIHIEKLRSPDRNLQYILNTMALACYAKVGGTSHVLNVDRADDGVTELVFGIGRATVGESRHGGEREQTIGFATVFRANGQYLYNDCTPYCEDSKYEIALEETITRTVTQVAAFEGLSDGAKLRLIFHLPRRPGRYEERAVLNAVGKLPRFNVEFALVHVNDDHQFQVFDTANAKGSGWKGDKIEAAFLPQRGLCTVLGPDERLITFVGPDQYRGYGSPGPVLLRLDGRSTVKDIDYLAQQLYALSFMNVGSLSPGVAPASIAYAEKLARLTGHLRGVQQWTVDLIHKQLGRKLWFV